MPAIRSSSCLLLPLVLLLLRPTDGGHGRAPGGIQVAAGGSASPPAAHMNGSQTVAGPTGARPYWHRPGCHRVGHTRTISIPGCVKFNLSTNACRGFCVSFSIPATEDIGPPPEQLDGPPGGESHALRAPTGGRPPEAATMDTQQLAALLTGQAALSAEPTGKQQQGPPLLPPPPPLIITRRMARNEADKTLAGGGGGDGIGTKGGQRMGEFLHLAGQTKSPLAGAVGDLSDRRDVISVGQCCNMMETEDVTINLRCGLNETRKLTFKSAKTCECFFCKHL